MRCLVLLALFACGPVTPTPHGDQHTAIFRPPSNAPPDPLGPDRPNGARSCNVDSDCKGGERCFAPDFSPSGGAAPQCQGDAQCTGGEVCLGKVCGPKCTPTSCGSGMRCNDAGHCEQLKCTDQAAPLCPMNSRCDQASGTCERVACSSASQCDQGVCWSGKCYAHSGYCMPAAYCCPP